MPSTPDQRPALPTKRLFRLRWLILGVAIWHVVITGAVFAVGRFQLFPARFYPSGLFAPDEIAYQSQCLELGGILRSEGLVAWVTWPTQLHLRFYSLPPAVVSRWLSCNVLTVEPVNLIYYLGILLLVLKCGEAIFDYRSGLLAAGVVAAWPSFLLHTTQLLRDPLLILAVLVLVWSVVAALRREVSLRPGLLLGMATAAAIVIIRIVRSPMWYLVWAAVGTAVLLLLLQAWREKRVAKGTIAFVVLLVAAVLVTPRLQPWFRHQQALRGTRINRR